MSLDRIRRMVPPRRRGKVFEILGDIDAVVSGWVRGQAIVTSLLAVLYALCFWVIGIPLAIPIGLLVGALTIIPFIGTFVIWNLQQEVSSIDTKLWPLSIGLFFIAMVFLFPDGVVSVYQRLQALKRHWSDRRAEGRP